MIRRILLSPGLLFSILLTVIGQQPAPRPASTPPPTTTTQQQNLPPSETQDVVRITANLVQVDVVVTKDGKPVTDLNAEDFEIFQDGRPQTITNFSYVSNVPENAPAKAASARSSDKNAPPVKPAIIRPQDPRRTIAIVVDDLGMSFESLVRAKNQIRKFIDELPPNDLVAIIITASAKVRLGAGWPPGDYILQIIVTDSSNPQKPRVASQWIDFEVIK